MAARSRTTKPKRSPKPKPSTAYSPKLAAKICDLIAEGESLQTIGAMAGMPSRRTMRDWLNQHPDFERQYEIARRERTDNLVDESIAIADAVNGSDNAAVQKARLQVDTRRWLASKLLPERFGDRNQVELTGKDGRDLIPEPVDSGKLALALLGVFSSAPGGRNHPDTPPPALPAVVRTTLLSAPIAPAEPVPVPVEPEPEIVTPAMARERQRWNILTGKLRVVE